MLRRIPGQARWRIFVDGDYFGDVFQNPDGTWQSRAEGAIGEGLSSPTGTRRDAARQLVGRPVTAVG
jgi:hypothetical protein